MKPRQVSVSFSNTDVSSCSAGFVGASTYQEVCDQVQALRKSVEDLVGRVIPHAVGNPDSGAGALNAPDQKVLDIAKQGMAVRRRREKVLGAGLFSEPAWDILLELYVARAENCDVTVGNACLAASVPMTTALRSGQMLEDRNMVYRERDPKDGRRIFLRIADATFVKLTALFAHAESASKLIR